MSVETAKAAPTDAGDTWTWTALDADSKLIVSYLVGGRDAEYANTFMDDVASRLATRVQLTTDGHKAYLDAVEGAFGADVDFAQLVKVYGASPDSARVVTAQRNVLELESGRSKASPTKITSARHSWSART